MFDVEDYEECVEKFNIHGCWKWSEGKVIIYEFPFASHEIYIGRISYEITNVCRNVMGTPAKIISFGCTQIRDINCGKEADASFRLKKPAVTPLNGSDRNDFPWPNLIVEVAYTETLDYVEEALRYWLSPGHAYDCIIVKIDPVPKAKYRLDITVFQQFEFGTQDGTGAPLNILQDQCIINIPLNCLYHNVKPPIQILLNILSDPIPIDFFFVQDALTEAYDI
ncbi:hypothetical protein Glove_88g23 [Diversispora epigaea]|uniref:Restriction endonuclease domain-containing protein n=1 Tax=Diversispora epigaea TaxID=1348612 RepID=A0A397J5T8_9GLOM|nr:hypothetical protein Glove_88g23 [Diversispora epigaea]